MKSVNERKAGIKEPRSCEQGRCAWEVSNVLSRASRGRAPARLRQPEPRMRLAVRGVPKGALRTHSA